MKLTKLKETAMLKMLKKFRNIFLLLWTILCLMACTIANPHLSNTNGDAIEKALRSDIHSSKKVRISQQTMLPDSLQQA